MPNQQEPKNLKDSGLIGTLAEILIGLVTLFYDNGRDKKTAYDHERKQNEDALVRASKGTAVATVFIAIASVLAFGAAIVQAFIFNRQLSVMQGQLSAMGYDQRPWVSNDPIITSNLTFTENGISISIDLRLKNPGKTPALNASPSGEMVFTLKENDLVRTQNKACEMARISAGYVVFPGNDPISQLMGFSGGKDEVAKAKAASTFPDQLIRPIIVGCISYVFGADNSRHETGFRYHLMHVPPFGIIDARNGDTPAAQLLLVQGISGNWAN